MVKAMETGMTGNTMLFYEMAALLRYAIDRELLEGDTLKHAGDLIRRFEFAHGGELCE